MMFTKPVITGLSILDGKVSRSPTRFSKWKRLHHALEELEDALIATKRLNGLFQTISMEVLEQELKLQEKK